MTSPTINRPPLRSTATVNAQGSAVARFTNRGSQILVVTQVTSEMANPGTTATCFLRFNGALVSPMNARTAAANGPPPLFLGPNDEITVEWVGATVGQVGTANAFYE